ncbi:glycosyltransferase family 2 protein [Alicyclobacillus sp. SO9]|uniref:tetratricopeptide repeat-containing glycosyltransferase family 2 protein n=1 Tax=Alicyclobacillus sp. SO9 TaxID=2665646 RepID=UPI0018E84461|nr:glycosyltransferase family 2 protein [Alicyclobacillus sp. SO9]QQE77140.1 glycosyltransferase [Alicyclobacillus sp. SO9]
MTSHKAISALIYEKDFQGARDGALSHLQRSKVDGQAWILLGQALRGMYRGDTAIRCFHRAAILNPAAQLDEEIQKCQHIANGNVDSEVERFLQVPQKRVSAILIVRNEIRTMRKCLAALTGAVDEMIVVDTGSTDGTDTVADEMGARLHRFVWNDDFAAARNFALSLVQTDWVLSVDADEILHDEDIDNIRTIAGLYDDIPGLFTMKVLMLNTFGSSASVSEETRMFPINRGLSWVRPIHEQIAATNVKEEITSVTTKIRFLHDGYNPDVVNVREKYARNARILEKHVQQKPKNYMSHKFLAREYLMLGKSDAARVHLKAARDLCAGYIPPLSNIDLMLIGTAEQVGEIQLAEELALQMTQDYPDLVDGWYLYGFYQLKKSTVLQKAKQYLSQAVEMNLNGKQSANSAVGVAKARLHLADVERLSGNWIEARRLYKLVLHENPDFTEVKNILSSMDKQIQQMADELKQERHEPRH